jgi:hypothetical protein
LSSDQVRWLFTAAETAPDEYPAAESRLIDIVEGLDVLDTRRVVEYWRQTVANPGVLDVEDQQQQRGLSLTATFEGMWRVDGWLTPLTGTALQAALDALTPPRRDGDTRTPRQRRHDALDDLLRDWLDNGTTPHNGGDKPHVIIHVDLPALQGIPGGLHETENGHILDLDTIRQITCDSSITRIIFSPDSEILDVGRRTRIWSPAQRRAITARDQHCQAPGCQTPARHCDIHHIWHWADGGPTNIQNGILYCRPCHTQHHQQTQHRQPQG